MIIFDTNAFNLVPPDGVKADIIRKLRKSGHQRVAVPWMVLEELAAHKSRHYPNQYMGVLNSLEKLRRALPWELESMLEPIDVERFLDHWRAAYADVFEVIQTSGDVALKALAREAMALPPAKRSDDDDHSEGARDVAIWFSILEFLEDNPDEHVYFVTNNTTDFGDGTVYKYPMDEDVRGLEHRLTRLKDFKEVVATFTTEVSGESAAAAAEELLRSEAMREQVAQTAVEALDSEGGYPGLGASGAEIAWRTWLAAPDVELLSVKHVTGHKIDQHVWYTADVEWLLYGSAVSDDGESALSVACVWRMKILFSTDEKEESPTILSGAPCMPDTADDRCMNVVRSLRQTAERLASRVTGSLTSAQDVSASAASAAAARLLASLPKADLATISAYQSTARALAEKQAKLDFSGILQPRMTGVEQLLASLPKITPQALALQQEAAKTIADSLPKLDFSGILQPRMTAVEQLLASLPKITPQALALQQEAAKTIAGLDRALANPTGESHDAEASDTVETDEGESGG
ncbi:PIN domain-containing protein [Streptomyces lydicus]|uniref:PIN domain-containing protein n=1 Tax=Streptomyces lydicus TaxID=47763 RepID=UPI002E311C12|nr:PIN domain-containing protein [Streptomyces lydicus]